MKPKRLEVVLPGRPVPWARPRKRKWGGFFTPLRQAAHRESLSSLIALKMREKGLKQFEGPVGLIAVFDYAQSETKLTFFEIHRDGFKISRADIDNMLKQILESAEDAGLIKDDAQFARVEAMKLK